MVTSRAPGVPGLKQVPCQQGKKMLAENSAFGEGTNKVFRIQGVVWGSGPDSSQQEGEHRCRTRTEVEARALCCVNYSGTSSSRAGQDV